MSSRPERLFVSAVSLQLGNTASRTDAFEFTDKRTAIDAERNQQWADLEAATAKASALLVDQNHAVGGKTTRLVITKAQKQQLFNWVDQHFLEFKNGASKDQWSNPAKSVQTCLKAFGGRKCADE